MKLCLKLITVLLSLFILTACQDEIVEKEIIRSVRAIQVADPSDLVKRWYPGQAKATQEVDLAFRVSGPLITLPINVGDVVKKGQDLSRIDPRDFEVSLSNAQGQLEKAQAELNRAQSDYDRMLRIQKQDSGAVSQSMIDRSRQIVESTGAEISSLKADVDAAKDRLSYTFLKASFDGIITATYVENFEDVKAKQPIVRLIDHSQIEMIVNIPEVLISQADELKAAGNVFRVRFDPFPKREIKARIKEIGKEASKTTRTYPVTMIMDQPDDIKILPGMAGKVSSTVSVEDITGEKSLIIPETAVFSTTDSQTYVWVIDGKPEKVSKREIKTGELLDTGVEVKEGLTPGEWIATAGVNYLTQGQEIRILKPSTVEVAK